jgi:hypothetical protein
MKFQAPSELYSPNCLEEVSLLKNSLGTRFRPRSGTKHAGFGAFQARFVVAISSTPTFSTASLLLGNPHSPGPMQGVPDRG